MYNLWTLIWLYLAFVPRMESNAHAAQKLYCSFHLTEGRKFWIRYIMFHRKKRNHALLNYVICFCFTLKIYIYILILMFWNPYIIKHHACSWISPYLDESYKSLFTPKPFFLLGFEKLIYIYVRVLVIIEWWEFCILYQ